MRKENSFGEALCDDRTGGMLSAGAVVVFSPAASACADVLSSSTKRMMLYSNMTPFTKNDSPSWKIRIQISPPHIAINRDMFDLRCRTYCLCQHPMFDIVSRTWSMNTGYLSACPQRGCESVFALAYNTIMTNPLTALQRTAYARTLELRMLYGAIVPNSLHWALVLYINSTYLEQFVSGKTVGLLYTVSALVTVTLFLNMGRIITRFGKQRVLILLSCVAAIALVGLGLAHTALLAIPLFIVHQAVAPLILFNLDLYMEEAIGEEEHSTGGREGLRLTIMSFAGALAPLLSGYLIGTGTPEFERVYFTSAFLMLIFVAIIVRSFRSIADEKPPHLALKHGLERLWQHKDIRSVVGAHFLLQFFFAWMVIYTPLFLSQVIGLDWEQIGRILFVGLMAYVFFEYAIGVIADRYIGEKEMMALGFLIIAVSTSWFAFIDGAGVALWMFAMFMTRVGASLVEATTESYFFKHTRSNDTTIISFFRMMHPLALVSGSLIGSLTLAFLPMNLLFVILGLVMIPGFFFAMLLNDTK